ncbi:MAG: hypothetical protein IPN75_04860 [Dechloromonas sp.]|uniref:Uncharacterized protein n=1 Tax=Candidatus Dechloromonas phosphorivorans TaxID=2899244 RepID=A0A9D7QH15_9RHOO|nr:hypothetical protein [Candidatus Dechloromonas phosphorivorans]
MEVLEQIVGGFEAQYDIEEVRDRIGLNWTGRCRVKIPAAFGADEIAA